jgi:hypothetical protein
MTPQQQSEEISDLEVIVEELGVDALKAHIGYTSDV